VAAPKFVNCPRCGASAPYRSENPFRPFCSERCKLIDLGAWANENYRVAVRPAEGKDQDEDAVPNAEADS
jgi:endogenous inhibitor of DNA gyrase (YacG/DUF329 family)